MKLSNELMLSKSIIHKQKSSSMYPVNFADIHLVNIFPRFMNSEIKIVQNEKNIKYFLKFPSK